MNEIEQIAEAMDYGTVMITEPDVLGMSGTIDQPAHPVESPVTEPVMPSQPSGVISIDVPLFMKLLEGGCGCGDHYKLASLASRKCSENGCVIGVQDFEDLKTQVAPADVPAPAASTEGTPAPAPLPDAPPPPAPTDEDEDEDDDEIDESLFPSDDEDGEDEDGEDEDDEEEEEGDDEDDGKKPPFLEGVASSLKAIEEIANTIDTPSVVEHVEPVESPVLAEEMTRLVKMVNPNTTMVFKETANKNAIEFRANPTPEFTKVFTESVAKTLSNKNWLKTKDFKALSTFNKVSIVASNNSAGRHFLVFA